MPKNETALTIKEMQTEIDKNFADPTTLNALLTITFNGMKAEVAKRAALEATMRGYTFKDFLEKNVYAIPYGDKYSLVSSIDHARKIGMRSGVCGKTSPVYEERDNKLFSCEITIKKIIPNSNGVIGEFSSIAYFAEYNSGRNLWISKPRTMLAKVAEMQALRAACPEELAQAYIEEEEPDRKAPATVSPAKAAKEEANAKLDYLKELLKTTGKTETAFLGFLNKSKMAELTEGEVDEWITKLEEGITAAKNEKIIEVEAETDEPTEEPADDPIMRALNGEEAPEPVYEAVPMEKSMLEKVMDSFPDAEVISTSNTPQTREVPVKPQTAKEKLDEKVNKLKNYKKQ